MRTETATGAHLLIATVARNDATTTLFFERLRDRVPLQFAELVPRSLRHVVRSIRAEARLAGDLSGAAALIVSRGLFEFRNLILAARSRRIPCFYFVDDNLMVLRAEGHADARHARGYRIDNVRNSLRAFDGVLCATEALREFFHEHRLHDRLQVYPPVATGPAVPSTRDDASLRLAFFGGGHRREPFMRIVWPAICRFAEHRDVTLCAAGLDDAALRPTSRLTIVTVPYQRDYDAALGAMRSHAIDVLLHPSSDTANNRYKNPHVLINARTLGAAPIFSNAPPYDAVASDGVCVLADNTPDSWLEALNAIADAGARSRMLANIDRYCEQHFNGTINVECLMQMLNRTQEPAQTGAAFLSLRLASGVVVDMLRRAVPGRG